MDVIIADIIDDAYLDLCLDGLVDQAPYQIRVKKDFDTACWSYVREKHIIFIGDKILNGCKKDIEVFDDYIRSFLYHEVGHSLYTERDLKMLSNVLKINNIPFALFNLAEDARIEHLIREKTERSFGWSEYEDLEEPITAVEQLFTIVQNDGDSTNLSELEHSERVIEFYNLFCNADDSMDVLEILIDWMDEFKNSQNETQDLQDKLKQSDEDGEPSSGARSLEDLALSLNFQEDEEALDEALAESEVIAGEKDEERPNLENESELNSTPVEEYTNAQVSSNHSQEWDAAKARELSEHFQNLFKSKSRYKNSRRQSSRINKKAFYQGSSSDKYFRAKEVETVSKKKITLILDCSGSMSSPMHKMRIVVGVFNELAKQGMVEGNVILSAVYSSKAIHETFNLPVKDEVIGKFDGKYGAEGIEAAMKSNLNLLDESDNIFVLTDGNIGDEPIKKDDYHMRGIYTVGIYVGNPDYCNLNKWFDKGIAVEEVEHCIDELVSYIGESND